MAMLYVLTIIYMKNTKVLCFFQITYIFFDHLDLFRCKLKPFINDFKYVALNVDRFDLLLHV